MFIIEFVLELSRFSVPPKASPYIRTLIYLKHVITSLRHASFNCVIMLYTNIYIHIYIMDNLFIDQGEMFICI